MKRLRVGLTVVQSNADAGAILWANGLNQNIVYLGMLLQRLDIVESVALVSSPGGDAHPIAAAFRWPVLPIETAVDHCDLIIEIGARGTEVHQLERLHKRKGKIVSYVAGNVQVMNFEHIAHGLAHGDAVAPFEFDAVWVTPQHWHTCASYLRMTRSPHTHIVPHIWDPFCAQMSAMEIGTNPYWRSPGEEGWRIGCFDPTVNVVKSFHIPLLCAEEAHRRKPSWIKTFSLFSALHLKESVHVNELIQATSLGRAGKVFAEARHRTAQVLGKHVDAVITHQWENNLNYLYWDVLYFGWPLIHNSDAISEVGYYFPSFDTEGGGKAVLEALRGHSTNRSKRREAEFDALWNLSVNNPKVQAEHARLIEMVMDQ